MVRTNKKNNNKRSSVMESVPDPRNSKLLNPFMPIITKKDTYFDGKLCNWRIYS